jgi:hypothetical protein
MADRPMFFKTIPVKSSRLRLQADHIKIRPGYASDLQHPSEAAIVLPDTTQVRATLAAATDGEKNKPIVEKWHMISS